LSRMCKKRVRVCVFTRMYTHMCSSKGFQVDYPTLSPDQS
jgi:hypothetical protein